MMLHCLNVSGGVSSGAELTVLERQRACMKWQQQRQQQQQLGLQYSQAYSVLEDGVENQLQAQVCGELSSLGQVGFPVVKPEATLDGAWAGFGNYGIPNADDFVSSGYADDSGTEYSYQMKKTASCPVSAICENSEGKESILTGRTSLRESSKKRKADMATSLKAVADNDTKDKKIKECAEDGEFKTTMQNRSSNNKNKIKGEVSAGSSKVSEVQKTDYIHVRARRGQATDSHSLAERVRREKISERMKYLQELVPGCHTITGKAGMLDEIINYVQSLQRQVEFLSMKLATVNPQLNFSIESLFEKEVFQPCTSSYPTLGAASEMTNPAYTQSNHLDEVISTGTDLQNYQPSTGLQIQLDAYVDTNAFNHINQNYSTWDTELQNLFSMEFQARSATYPSQALTGSIEANNMKMEI